jgi:GNAT superfamily N-acetyltransferase
MKKQNQKEKTRIRRAKMKDAARLAELAGELGYPTTTAQMKRRLKQIKPASQHAVLVAVRADGNEIVGWLHLSVEPLLEVDMRGEVNGLVVGESYRSLGAGAELLAAAEKWARKQGCKSISLRSNVIRERAHKFYERHGYEHYKTQKAFRKPF